MNILFWGTPQTAVPFLERLCEKEKVVGAVTKIDKASDRGQKLSQSPVKVFAERKNLPVLQPSNLKDAAFAEQVRALQPDLGVVVAYGKIIPQEIIDLFPQGLFNVHFSLLPALRGAAPMQWSLLNGDRETGVCFFRIVPELDAGGVVARKAVPIAPDDDAVTLEAKLVPAGIEVMREALAKIKAGTAEETPQEGDPTFARTLKKEDAKIRWSDPADVISRQVRALVKMGAFCKMPGQKTLKILRAEISRLDPKPFSALPSGALCQIERGKGFIVKCGDGLLTVLEVQLEGKKPTDAWSFLQGARLKAGDSFF